MREPRGRGLLRGAGRPGDAVVRNRECSSPGRRGKPGRKGRHRRDQSADLFAGQASGAGPWPYRFRRRAGPALAPEEPRRQVLQHRRERPLRPPRLPQRTARHVSLRKRHRREADGGRDLQGLRMPVTIGGGAPPGTICILWVLTGIRRTPGITPSSCCAEWAQSEPCREGLLRRGLPRFDVADPGGRSPRK